MKGETQQLSEPECHERIGGRIRSDRRENYLDRVTAKRKPHLS